MPIIKTFTAVFGSALLAEQGELRGKCVLAARESSHADSPLLLNRNNAFLQVFFFYFPPSLCPQFFGRKPSAFSVTRSCCEAPEQVNSDLQNSNLSRLAALNLRFAQPRLFFFFVCKETAKTPRPFPALSCV